MHRTVLIMAHCSLHPAHLSEELEDRDSNRSVKLRTWMVTWMCSEVARKLALCITQSSGINRCTGPLLRGEHMPANRPTD